MSTEKEAFAHHEAGDAVVAMLQGMQVRSISVERTNDSGGETDLHEIGMPIEELGQIVEDGKRPTAYEIIILEQHVRMSLAGEIAQFHFVPKSVHDFHASFDTKFLEFLNRIAGSEREVNAWTELLRIQTCSPAHLESSRRRSVPAEHALGDLEVDDRAVSKRPNRDDRSERVPEYLFRLGTDRQRLPRATRVVLHCDHRPLHYNAPIRASS
jgi:hypothetical protein